MNSESSRAEEIHFRVLRLLEARPQLTQRQLAQELGISLGKANYCVKAMLEKGWIKVNNFKNSHNKIAYAYLLTPAGFEKRAKMTVRFLKRKMAEFESLEREIEQLRREVNTADDPNSSPDTAHAASLPGQRRSQESPRPQGGEG